MTVNRVFTGPRPCFVPQRRVVLVHSSLQSGQKSNLTDVEKATSLLKKAAESRQVRPKDVFAALRTLEKAKELQLSEWPEIVGGPGKRWELVFTTGTAKVREAMKGQGDGGGNYFPLTAAQRWDASKSEIENGVYLGLLAALTFKGKYACQGSKLSFDFDTLKLRLGPLKFEFKLKDKIVDYRFSAKDPFFVFFFVDEDIIAARGRGGGIAFWKKAGRDFDMKHLSS
jgi:hypothetical protein